MMHTGDIYEQRARAARHQELRALAKALSGFLFRPPPGRKAGPDTEFRTPRPVNDRTILEKGHAA